MTKELLEDYPYIVRRLGNMEEVCVDTVEGSSPEFPYAKHTVSIQGVPNQSTLFKRLSSNRREIEDWVESLPSDREKLLIELHALKGLSWPKVFRQTGDVSPDAARKQYERILKKYL